MKKFHILFSSFINKIKIFVEKCYNMCYNVIIKKSINYSDAKINKGGVYMYDVLDVCRYVINYSNDKDYGISNLKLQKILYFIQAAFLTISERRTACFAEKIEAWDFGPVVPEAYHEFKQYGSGNIPSVQSYYDFNSCDLWNIKQIEFSNDCINDDDKEIINGVVDVFSEASATDLVTLTHNQAPWKDAYSLGKNSEITRDAIRGFFDV